MPVALVPSSLGSHHIPASVDSLDHSGDQSDLIDLPESFALCQFMSGKETDKSLIHRNDVGKRNPYLYTSAMYLLGNIDEVKNRRSPTPTTSTLVSNLRDIGGESSSVPEKSLDTAAHLLNIREQLLLTQRYVKLGWHKGKFGGRKLQERVKQFWIRGSDYSDFVWLLNRAGTENNVDVLDAVSDVISERMNMDRALQQEVLRRLESPISPVFAETLLRALQWTTITDSSTVQALKSLLAAYSRSLEPSIREAVYFATRALPTQEAREILTSAVSVESDVVLIDIISEELRYAEGS